MNKSDKYYLKKGKLELSMLEEEEYEHECVMEPIRKSGQKDLMNNLEFEHTRRLRDIRNKEQQRPQQTLKVSKDVYNTLHTMGKFLTKTEPQPTNVPVRKSINSAKAQKLEQIASSIKVQEIELPSIIDKQNQFNTLNISHADQIKEINEAVSISSVERNQVDTEFEQIEGKIAFDDTRRIDRTELETLAINLDYRSQEAFTQSDEATKRESDIEAQIEASYRQVSQKVALGNESVKPGEECVKIRPVESDGNLNRFINKSQESSILDQNNIDNILASFFKTDEPQNAFSRKLKKHIDKHIMAIKNYK